MNGAWLCEGVVKNLRFDGQQQPCSAALRAADLSEAKGIAAGEVRRTEVEKPRSQSQVFRPAWLPIVNDDHGNSIAPAVSNALRI